MVSSSCLAGDASWLGAGRPAGRRGKPMRERRGRRMVTQPGHADSQRWVKFGQEAHCGCPKMASPSYSASKTWHSTGKPTDGVPVIQRRERGQDLVRQLGCFRTAILNTCAPQEPLQSLLSMGRVQLKPLFDFFSFGQLSISS